MAKPSAFDNHDAPFIKVRTAIKGVLNLNFRPFSFELKKKNF